MRKPNPMIMLAAVFGLLLIGPAAGRTYADERSTNPAAAAEPRGHRPHRLARALARETMDRTGLTRQELKAELKSGKPLAQVAGEHGSGEQAVVDAVLARLGARLDQAVADGKITAEQKAGIMARAADRAHAVMNKTR